MAIKKIVFLFYLLYTVYTLLMCGTTNLTFIYMLPSLILMWMFYLCFILGFYSINKKNNSYNHKNKEKLFKINLLKCGILKLMLLAIFSIFISIISIKFYTNLYPLEVIRNLYLGISNYNNYQIYFNQVNLKEFSLEKIPYIILLGIKNIIFVYSFIFLICKAPKLKLKYIIYLMLLTIAHLYFGIARGTNYEVYQLFLLLTYCYVQRKQINNEKINISIIIGMGLVLTGIFHIVVLLRGVELNYYITEHIRYIPDELFSILFSKFSIYYTFLYSYLGFGLYYISTLINEILMSSISNFLESIIPLWDIHFNVDPIEMTNKLVVIGVRWVPDAVVIIKFIGVLGIFILCYITGYFLKKVYIQVENSSFFLLFSYFIFLFLVIIPNGKYLVSSSDKILFLYTIVMYIKFNIKCKFKNYINRENKNVQ